MIGRVTNNLSKCLRLERAFSTLQKAAAGNVTRSERLQFSKARLTEFGELPHGQIPTALEFDRPTRLETLANGVRVVVEPTVSQLASLSVVVRAGTRQETLETSGVAQFLKRLVLRGTQKRSREQIEKELVQLGANISVEVSRETTTYTLSLLPENVEKGVEFLGDILQNSVLAKAQVDAEKDAVFNNALSTQNDQQAVILESVHFTSYRDHFMGQPSHGIRENVHNITEQDVQNFFKTNYVAQNFVVAAAGNVNADAVLKAVEKSFSTVPQRDAAAFVPNTEKPYFTPSYMTMRDDELHNLNVGVFFEAPSWTDPDFYAAQFFQRVLGEYQADKYTGQHLNTSDRQYSQIHKELGNLPDVTLHKCHYLPYSDTGLFGNYFYGNEVFGNQMLYLSQMLLSEYASTINQAEVFRARAKYFNELLSEQNSAKIANTIATQVTFLGRRVPRSEEARRISTLDAGLLNRAATRMFWDKELALVTWGPSHGLMASSHYNRNIKRSTLGWYGNHHYQIV